MKIEPQPDPECYVLNAHGNTNHNMFCLPENVEIVTLNNDVEFSGESYDMIILNDALTSEKKEKHKLFLLNQINKISQKMIIYTNKYKNHSNKIYVPDLVFNPDNKMFNDGLIKIPVLYDIVTLKPHFSRGESSFLERGTIRKKINVSNSYKIGFNIYLNKKYKIESSNELYEPGDIKDRDIRISILNDFTNNMKQDTILNLLFTNNRYYNLIENMHVLKNYYTYYNGKQEDEDTDPKNIYSSLNYHKHFLNQNQNQNRRNYFNVYGNIERITLIQKNTLINNECNYIKNEEISDNVSLSQLVNFLIQLYPPKTNIFLIILTCRNCEEKDNLLVNCDYDKMEINEYLNNELFKTIQPPNWLTKELFREEELGNKIKEYKRKKEQQTSRYILS